MDHLERHRRIHDLFDEALVHSPESRYAFLVQECGDHTSLRDAVARLLTIHERAEREGFLSPGSTCDETWSDDPSPHRRLECPRCRGRIEDVALVVPGEFLCPFCGATFPLEERPTMDSQGSPPERLGRFQLLEVLGSGGFGTVYKAHDPELDRLVAIKVPNSDRIVRPEDLEAHLNEARVLAKLEHENIIPIYDVFRTENRECVVVYKYVDGRDLADHVRRRPLDAREAAGLVAAVAEALHHAHTRGLVHRDVKPENILIDATGAPHVADFGLALTDEEYGKGGRLAGTPSYMSPEQAHGEGHLVDGRSDVFSLGVIFYELLTARRPFVASTQRAILDLIATTEARPPRQIDDSIPRELERICLKAMA
ncbi:MAG: serine/threonine-protein kinase, partial [Isosphaeraceae bacterium]